MRMTGVITTYAGGGASSAENGVVLATDADMEAVFDVAFDASGNLHIAINNGSGGSEFRVRVVDAGTNQITTAYAGNGTRGINGDGGLATDARTNPFGLAFDNAGNLLIANYGMLRRVDSGTGIISTIAGTSLTGFNGDGLLALWSNGVVYWPSVDSQGNIFFTDNLNSRIRRIDADTQIMTTIAGTGVDGYNGENIPASTAQVNGPISIFASDDGNLYIAENNNSRVRMIEAQTAEVNAGDSFNWRVSVHNTGTQNISLTGNNVILRDYLPSTATYGTPTIENVVDVTNIGNISCDIASDILTCDSSGSVTIDALTGHFEVVIPVTTSAAGTLTNPTGGECAVNPDSDFSEDDTSDNDCSPSSVEVVIPPPEIAVSGNGVVDR